jgi:putative MATE family efflux protein
MTDIQKKAAFETLPVPKALTAFILPTVLSNLIGILYNMADTFFVGHTGDTSQIAALSIVTPVFLVMSVVSAVFSVGANAGISSSLGAGNKDRARQIASFSLYTSIGIVCILAIILAVFMRPFLYLIGAKESNIGFCVDYLFWAFIVGCIPFVSSHLLAQSLLAEGEARLAAIGSALGGILNIILDPIFIFTLDMGIEGAAIATCISNYAALLFFIIVYIIKRKNLVFSLNPKYWSGRNGVCSSVLLIGIPSGFALCLTVVCDFFRMHYISALGTETDLAAFGVVQKIGNLTIQLSVGMAQGIRPLVAYNYSSGNRARMRALMRGSAVAVLSFVFVCVALLELFPRQAMSIFLTDTATIALGAVFMRQWVICQIGLCSTDLINAFFQAMGKWKQAMFITFFNKGLLLIPVMLLLIKLIGMSGVIWVQPITENVTLLVALTMFLISLSKIKEINREA